MKRLGFLGLIAACLLAVGWLAFSRTHVWGGGPVSGGDSPLDDAHRSGIGERISFGVLLTNEAKKPARIERVRVLGVSEGLEVLGVRTRPVPDERGKGMFLLALDFPPPEWPSKPLNGQRVVPVAASRTPAGSPENGLELVVGMRASQPGVARFRAIEFTYRVGSRRYRSTYKGRAFLCAPAERYDHENCPGDWNGHFSDVNVEARSG